MSCRRTEARRLRVRRILELLERAHDPRPPRPPRSRGKCLDVLVACMLTQNTNMANARSGFRQLRRAFPSWTRAMLAPVHEVQRPIAVCGLARMRARRLQDLLRTIKQRHGKLDLQFLAGRPPREAFEYLMSFYGIGPKTAAATLLFSFNMPLFPVDKGIHRMCRRLKLVRPRAREAETESAVEALLDPPAHYPLHVLMFRHAKDYCRPRNPKCRDCPLLGECPCGKSRARHQRVRDLDPPPRPRRLALRASAGLAKHGDAEIEVA